MTDKLFISHSHTDKPIVRQFAEALTADGVEVFLDEWDLLAGDSLVDGIFERGIAKAAALAIILSPASLTSPWVRAEVNAATIRRIEEQMLVIPVLIADVTVPMALRDLVAVDIRRGFEAGIRKVLNALRKTHVRPPLGHSPPHIQNLAAPIGGLTRLGATVGEWVINTTDPGSHVVPDFGGAQLTTSIGFNVDEVNDAVAELEGQRLVKTTKAIGTPYAFVTVSPTYRLFERFRNRLSYDPARDIRMVIAAVVTAGTQIRAERLKDATELPFGRLNRAVEHIAGHGLAEVHREIRNSQYWFVAITPTAATRREAAKT
jgi:hypothetical protein